MEEDTEHPQLMLCLDIDDLITTWNNIQHHALRQSAQIPEPSVPSPTAVHTITISQQPGMNQQQQQQQQQMGPVLAPHLNRTGQSLASNATGSDTHASTVEPELSMQAPCEKPKKKRTPKPSEYGQNRFTLWRWKNSDPYSHQQRRPKSR